MTVYVLGIGSNLNAEYKCRQMIASIKQAFDKVRVSELVTTKAIGVEGPDYMNGVVCFESDIHVEALLLWCKALEKQLGRDRNQNLCAADIDLLLAFDCTGEQPTEDSVNQIKEPWFRPLVVGLLCHDI
ncbi:2-amino-4-hydroxy-6-hydroxymethyldihydropteridine diphosphokinase [Endozoicomonas elysicola]|uniref:2-amino-4-hydroxy-6-hydroxymethyldihydropteridine pyrophosphokinase n=1 Tax=Endozoicomonas elysicola TaxID=305900 RepID=A0A081KG80_9GAMM|nr:2-amino-4-hydroxy-6-hydroxymethyldihydropteridine diphosphokinase [Endozoicomonas elysicola]KEI73156.1 hypothetical protein GV64_22775 [Endozoicomonas elysicola]